MINQLGSAVILRWLAVAVVVMAAMFWGYRIMTAERKTESSLPYVGDKTADGSLHRISQFSLLNQMSKKVTLQDIKGKVIVADFFFVNCEGICPIMTGQMKRIHEYYKGNDELVILSHTVKPEEDSIPVLKAYAEGQDADEGQWHFLTGPKKEIYELARQSYLVNSDEGSGDENDFIHTQFFSLADKDQHIRGIYDGTDSAEVDRLIRDIGELIKN
jgi:protein SCO1